MTSISAEPFRQRLHRTGFVWNRYKIGPNKPFVYTGPGRSSMDWICYLVLNGSTYEGDSIWKPYRSSFEQVPM